MPRQSLLVELFHERIRIKLLYVPYARLAPQTFEEHHCTNHGGHTCCVAYALHASLLVSLLMRAVVINIICALLAVFQSADTAAYACLAVIVLAEILRIRQHGLEELQRNNLNLGCLARAVGQRSLIFNLVDARHADVLNNVEICQVLLSEGHPEACLLDCRIILNEALQLLMVHQIALTRTDVRISERLVNLERLGFKPLAVLIVKSLLSNLADVNLRVEVCCESLMVVSGVAVNDVEILNLVE